MRTTIVVFGLLLISLPVGTALGQNVGDEAAIAESVAEYARSKLPASPSSVAFAHRVAEYRIPEASARIAAERLGATLVGSDEPMSCTYSAEGKQSCSITGGHGVIVMLGIDPVHGSHVTARIRILEHVGHDVFHHDITIALRKTEGRWRVHRILDEEIG